MSIFSDSLRQKAHVVYEITKMSIKTRNEGSHLGFLWYLLDPLIMFATLTVVFSRSVGAEIDQYPLYLLTGIIHWQLISFGVDRMVQKVVNSGGLLKSMNIEPELLVIAEGIFTLVTFAVSAVIFLSFALILGAEPAHVHLYPFLLLSEVLLMFGLAFFIATAYVYVRDVLNVWLFLKQIWWFMTPIFYGRVSVPDEAQFLYRFNPMYHVINGSREVLIYGSFPENTPILKLLTVSTIFCLMGFFVFKKFSKKLNELF